MVDLPGAYVSPFSVLPIKASLQPPLPSGAIDSTGFSGAIREIGKWFDGSGDIGVVDFLPQFYDGYLEQSYFTIYYNRLWMIPTTIDFGPVTTDAYRDVYLWNAHMRPTTITEIINPADPSVGISDITIPLRLRALGSEIFRVHASADGEPTIDSTFTFIADPSETTRIRVLGMRSRIWPFPPNWTQPYEIAYELRTEVITSRSGKEQRISLRQNPRKTYSFTTLVHDNRFRAFLRHMNSWQQRSTVMPEYSRLTRLSQPVVDGSISIVVDEVPEWLVPNRLISLYDGNRAIVRGVEGVIGNAVSLAAAIDGDWPTGIRVYAAEVGRLSPNIQATQHTNITSSVNVSFEVEPGSEYMPPTSTPERVYRGREVFLKRPNWGTAPTPEFQAVIEKVDYGVGTVDHFLPVRFNTKVQKGEFIGVNTADVKSYVDFFRRQYGQTGEFFMPTFTHDIKQKVSAPQGSSNLRIEGTEFFDDYGQSDIYRDIAVFMSTGEILTYRALDIYIVDDADGRDTAIQVDSPFPFEISEQTTRQICWMPLWRLLSDTLTVQHVTTEAANISLNMKTLEQGEAQ